MIIDARMPAGVDTDDDETLRATGNTDLFKAVSPKKQWKKVHLEPSIQQTHKQNKPVTPRT